MNHMVITSGLYRFDLDAIVIRAVGNQYVCLMPVIEDRQKDLPSILH